MSFRIASPIQAGHTCSVLIATLVVWQKPQVPRFIFNVPPLAVSLGGATSCREHKAHHRTLLNRPNEIS